MRTWYRVKVVKKLPYNSVRLLPSRSMYRCPSVYGTKSSSIAVSSIALTEAAAGVAADGVEVRDFLNSEVSRGDRGIADGSS